MTASFERSNGIEKAKKEGKVNRLHRGAHNIAPRNPPKSDWQTEILKHRITHFTCFRGCSVNDAVANCKTTKGHLFGSDQCSIKYYPTFMTARMTRI